ncbi:MAG: dihydroorotate dehydrogenase electron transfer subunit [Proteobacteria bacterium]|nr:dihydroorotate dehydrogenase electron transfer subunit [Pseudomonadota bacterium]MBU1687653.1 dihydroorotate dehydrogenase electron transfer subunit [Pseudomonadota bacterium]
MTSYQTNAEILRKEQITGDIFRLTLNCPEIADQARPGQFIMLKASAKNTPFLRRPFSVHQTSINGRVQVLFKVLGKGTEYLASCTSGTLLSVVGPLGRGFTLPQKGTSVCLIGGGMGIAPLFFLAKRLSRHHDHYTSIKVMLGAATAKELLTLKSDFEQLGMPVEMATDDGSAGHHGFVTDLVQSTIGENPPWAFYTCGPHPMMKKIALLCREKDCFCEASLETMMACGIGACLGCVIPRPLPTESGEQYFHVCKDGPVFDAGDILWK